MQLEMQPSTGGSTWEPSFVRDSISLTSFLKKISSEMAHLSRNILKEPVWMNTLTFFWNCVLFLFISAIDLPTPSSDQISFKVRIFIENLNDLIVKWVYAVEIEFPKGVLWHSHLNLFLEANSSSLKSSCYWKFSIPVGNLAKTKEDFHSNTSFFYQTLSSQSPPPSGSSVTRFRLFLFFKLSLWFTTLISIKSTFLKISHIHLCKIFS